MSNLRSNQTAITGIRFTRDVRMTEREVHTAFHRPKWIRRIDTPAERMQRFDEVLAQVRAEVENAISMGIRYVVDLRKE